MPRRQRPDESELLADAIARGATDELDPLFGTEPWDESRHAPALKPVGPNGDANRWQRAVARDQHGKPEKSSSNAAFILAHDPCWRGVLRFDELAGRVVVGELPDLTGRAHGFPALDKPTGDALTDQVVLYGQFWFRSVWSREWPEDAMRRALEFEARRHPFNPIADYLEECERAWDGAARLADWLARYLGAEDSDYVRTIGERWLISAVARALTPGVKVDHVLVLEGPQGSRKNTALEVLFSPWYLPELPDVRDKDAMALLRGRWCCCIDELSAFRAADKERIKSFLTRRVDVFRRVYDREVTESARVCVFAATTNQKQYLHDETGDRRYWGVWCGAIDVDALERDRAQLWGEARRRQREGARWWPETDAERGMLEAEQEARKQVDEWEPTLAAMLAHVDWTTVGLCLSHLGAKEKDWTPADQHRVVRVLRRLGWELRRTAHERRWYPAGASEVQSEAQSEAQSDA